MIKSKDLNSLKKKNNWVLLMKHVTVRFAWHDSGWNGRVCVNPKDNVYCVGNYSLLSPRIQRRRNLKIEEKCKGLKLSDVIRDYNYLPPCYWCINLLGNEDTEIEHVHPFEDIVKWGSEFKTKVPHLKDMLHKFSVFSWCFKLSFNEELSPEGRYPRNLKDRVAKYLDQIEPGKSMIFFYANFSNPLTGEKHKRLLLGVALVEDKIFPQDYNIPPDLLKKLKSGPGMQNFPKIAWHFQLKLNPETIILLPYHKYLKWMKEDKSIEVNKKLKMIEEIVIPIDDDTLEPHFKYVSMHLSHDKAIYLLYMIRKSIRKMNEHKLVSNDVLKDLEKRLDKLLKLAWENRGKYPGFTNVVKYFLRRNFREEYLEKILPKVNNYIIKNYGGLKDYLENNKKASKSSEPEISRVINIINKNKEIIRFLSMFDFSEKQFENVIRIINRIGKNLKQNPYLIAEEYYFDNVDDWNIDKSDWGIGIYQIDIALIPDPEYTNWYYNYDADSCERIRALIIKILHDIAMQGHTYATRDEIIKLIKEYPLYYIGEKLGIDEFKLAEYEESPLFKEKMIIKKNKLSNQVLYQLRIINIMEKSIEKFIKFMLRKEYTMDDSDEKYIHRIIEEEKKLLLKRQDVSSEEKRMFLKERNKLYKNAFSKGLFLISGKAGSGKTQAIINLIRRFREKSIVPIFIFTPTGKANLVIKKRLEEIGLRNDKYIRLWTIHRFLYGELLDRVRDRQMMRRWGDKIFKLIDLISKLDSGKFEVFDEFKRRAEEWKFTPKVVIIDEASMVDEVLLVRLFSMIDCNTLQHLILVGDENQLPPIGVGRPFTDVLYYLKSKELESNYICLRTNLRFSPHTKLGKLAEIFSQSKCFSPIEVKQILEETDNTLEIYYFSNLEELKNRISTILHKIAGIEGESIFELFKRIFERDNKIDLDRVQILSPRRTGIYGTIALNIKLILNNNVTFSKGTKLICEENIYIDIKRDRKVKRILGLANGSMGYIKSDGRIYFDEINEVFNEYGKYAGKKLLWKVLTEIYNPLKVDRHINFGYAITVHKAQGSDFEHIILIIPEMSKFISKELLYTAFTRAKKKLYIILYKELIDEFPSILVQAYENSMIKFLKTTLFGLEKVPMKPFKVVLKDGSNIFVRSKIEYIIAKALDENGVKFEYEPTDFIQEYHILPDFKLKVNNKVYYWEHLGRLDDPTYKERWYKKFEIYKRIGIADQLITTSESEEVRDIMENVKKIINDIKLDNLKKTEGKYSFHHYSI